MSYYSKKIKLLQKKARTLKYPLVYEPKRWRFVNAGSYAYALDLDISDPKQKVLIPGYISSEFLSRHDRPILSANELMRRIKKDLKFLEIYYREEDDMIWDDEYRIAIYYKYIAIKRCIEYRVIRQDHNGKWSEKQSWKGQKPIIVGEGDYEAPDFSEEGFKLAEVLVLHE